MSLTLLKYGVGGLLTLAGGVTVYKIVEWKQDNVKSYIRVEALRMKLGISDQSDVTSFNLRENLLHKLCIGTWAWGAYAGNKISAWKGTPNNSKEDNEDAFNAAMDAGVCFFDTAEVYNGGESERLIGEFIRNRRYRSIREKKDKYNDGIHANSDENDDDGDFSSPLLENEGINNYASLDINDATENGDERKGEDMAALLPPSSFRPIVATKFIPLPVPWRGFQSSVMQALYQSLDRLNLPYVDLYQIHGPAFSLRSVDVWAEGLVECYEKGLARAVGVSNYNSQEVKTTHRILDEHGVKLASNQIEYSLLHRLPELNGLIDTCKRLDVEILAYSPLAMGRLTGKYTKEDIEKDNLTGDRKFGKASWEELEPIIEALREVGGKYGKTPAQVSIKWVIQKGCIPICGAKNGFQARQNCGSVASSSSAEGGEWMLTDEEMQRLDDVSLPGTTNFWQGTTK